MRPNYTRTQSAKYFLQTYNCSSIQEAVEVAAEKEREILLPGYESLCKIPVDINEIATRKGIIIGKELPNNNTAEATLLPSTSGYIVRMAPEGTNTRDRYSLAHEIGHTLFREGMKHRIGKISKEEQAAEELICHRFAAALLMPKAHVIDFITKISIDDSWEIFTHFERVALRFKVSLPFLITRIGQVKPSKAKSLLFLCFRFFPNKFTLTDPSLRVDICSPIGSLSNMRTWSNRTAAKLCPSAEQLFRHWVTCLSDQGEPSGGKYTIKDSNQIVRATKQTTQWKQERILLSMVIEGKWQNQTIDMLVSNCLYAKKGWNQEKAYIFSILKKP